MSDFNDVRSTLRLGIFAGITLLLIPLTFHLTNFNMCFNGMNMSFCINDSTSDTTGQDESSEQSIDRENRSEIPSNEKANSPQSSILNEHSFFFSSPAEREDAGAIVAMNLDKVCEQSLITYSFSGSENGRRTNTIGVIFFEDSSNQCSRSVTINGTFEDYTYVRGGSGSWTCRGKVIFNRNDDSIEFDTDDGQADQCESPDPVPFNKR